MERTSTPLDRRDRPHPGPPAYERFHSLIPRPRSGPGAKRPSSLGLSLSFHFALAVALLVVPLFLDESLPDPAAAIHAFFVDNRDLAPPPPPPPPPPPLQRRAPKRAAVPRPIPRPPEREAPFVAPIEVPEELPLEEGLQIDLGGEGVEGGVAGGIPGGVVGGIVGGLPRPPPPPSSAPVVRVGGAVKAPELIERIEPEYPKLARDAHVQGVVILTVHVDASGRIKSVEVLRGPMVLGTLRESGGAATGTIDRLHREHRALLCRVVELESGACPPEDLPRFARAVREHIELEDGLLAPAEEAMSHVPVWRAEELYERAGGPTEYWVEKWLG